MESKNLDNSFWPYSSSFGYERSERTKSAMLFGHFLLYSYAERLDGSFDDSYSLGKSADQLIALGITPGAQQTTPYANWSDFFEGLIYFSGDIFGDAGTYAHLMHQVRWELNFFINGCNFPGNGECTQNDSHIKDPVILDWLADSLGDLDGIVGFILAGNPNCSKKLLEDLSESDYSHMGTSTRVRVLDWLQSESK
jgi:hypothetical protein